MNEVDAKKNLIERIWWIIPPVFLIFVYWPLIGILLTSSSSPGPLYSQDMWVKDILYLLDFREGGIYTIFMFGLMVLGNSIVINKKLSLKYKIIIPSLFGVIGMWVGFIVVLFLYME